MNFFKKKNIFNIKNNKCIFNNNNTTTLIPNIIIKSYLSFHKIFFSYFHIFKYISSITILI